MNNKILPSQVYEWTFNNFDKIPKAAQDILIDNLELLAKKKEVFDLTQEERYEFKRKIINKIRNASNSNSQPILLYVSGVCYNLSLCGVDVSDLENEINSKYNTILIKA